MPKITNKKYPLAISRRRGRSRKQLVYKLEEDGEMMSDNDKVELLNSYFEIAQIEIAAQIVKSSTVGSRQEM